MKREHLYDKSGWEEGVWTTEPDRVAWRYRGYPCLIRRNPELGHLCGYVAVPPGHPWHGGSDALRDVHVHGGITYTAFCDPEPYGVCHVPAPGEPDDVFWVGFDCGHSTDVRPGLIALFAHLNLEAFMDCVPGLVRPVYRDLAYVTREVEHLADQAAFAVEAAQIYKAAQARVSQRWFGR